MSDDENERILIVEDQGSQRKYLAQSLQSNGYQVLDVHSAEAAIGALRHLSFDLALLDITLPGRSGIELLRYIHDTFPEMAAIMVTGVNDIGIATEVLRMGACDYILKPYKFDDMLSVIDRALVERKKSQESRRHLTALESMLSNKSGESMLSKKAVNSGRSLEELVQIYNQIVLALGEILGFRDSETEQHCTRVAAYSFCLAQAMGIDEVDSLRHLKWGAYLHDIGKIGISDKILLKKGPLTKSEYTFIQQHPELGYRMLQKIPFLKRSAEIVYCHHEKFDGTGYPQKLCGHTIPSLARVFAVADAIDAITSDRPYRKAQYWSNVSWELNQNKGSHFDPAVIEAFHSVPRDEWIQLRDNSDVTILQ